MIFSPQNKQQMATIKELLLESKGRLQKVNIPSYSLDADLLMAHAINSSREDVFLNRERQLSQQQETIFNDLIKRRESREPMSHIVGKREFWGMEFKVTKDTLDPRPDSESLIEQVLHIYKDKKPPKKIIDFGTGTGCLLLTLLSEFKEAEGVGVDKSKGAILVAEENSKKLELAKRVSFVVSNWGENVKGEYDLIISNPPYIRNNDIEGLEPEVSNYEPKDALDGGNSGLECYIDLAPDLFRLLSNGGFAVLEHGVGQEADVKKILENNNLNFVSYKKDLAGINRCVTVKKQHA